MIARLPSAMLPLAILLVVNTRLGSLAAAGLIVGAFSLGRAAASPLVGALIDRLGQFWVLVSGATVQAILLGGLLLAVQVHASVSVTALVAALAGAASPPWRAPRRRRSRPAFAPSGQWWRRVMPPATPRIRSTPPRRS